ncbi:MAG: CCA tRNA nucleotidyltransferase [Verrucomicrobiota bacterium]
MSKAVTIAIPDQALRKFQKSRLYKNALRIVEKLSDAGFTTYFAGGSVRDVLLGLPCKDIDIATAATPNQVQKLFSRVTDLQGKSFGVVRVIVDKHSYEVAAFRTDGDYKDGRRPEKIIFSSPEEDAFRRDFTINGLFFDPTTHRVIDYVHGLPDLKAGVIRAIGDPKLRFREDRLRLFRALRFAAEFRFEVEEETWNALEDMSSATASPKKEALPPERVRVEITKMFTGSTPVKAMDLLDKSGLLKLWLPEIDALKGVKQPPQFHPEGDVYVHTRMMIEMLTDQRPSTALAFGTLFHDIGKPKTYKVDETGRIRFNEHEHVGARMTEKVMKRLRFSNEDIQATCALVAGHMKFKDAPKMKLSTLKRFLAQPYFSDELKLHRIDCLSSHGDLGVYQFIQEKQAELSQEEIAPAPLITGSDLLALGLKPGPQIGQILSIISDGQLEGALQSKEEALRKAQELIDRDKQDPSL